jgi:MFS family permease
MPRLRSRHLAIASFWNGVGWATDNPVRRMMIGEVAGPARMGRAMSMDIGANNASRMVGPTLGGLLLVSVDVAGVFCLAAVLYGLALAAAFRLQVRNAGGTGGVVSQRLLARVMEGLTLVRRDRRLVGTLVVTVIFNVFGWPCVAMVPVIGREAFGLEPAGIGLLSSLDGIGSFAGAILVGVLARQQHYARVYLGGIVCYLLGLLIFAFAPGAYLAGVTLFLTGIGASGFAIMQTTLVFLAVPAEMRSRVLGVLSVCIGIGPVGFVLVGGLAEWLGAQNATAMSSAGGLLAMALTYPWWRDLLRPRSLAST